MKTLFAFVFLLGCVSFAQEDFAARKQEMLTNIDKGIAKKQEHRACVNAAQNQEDMKKCHMDMREHHMEKRMEHMDKKMDRMERKKGRMEEKMKKMHEAQGTPETPKE